MASNEVFDVFIKGIQPDKLADAEQIKEKIVT